MEATESIKYFRISGLNETTTDDCLEFYLKCFMEISFSFIERNLNGVSKKTALLAITEDAYRTANDALKNKGKVSTNNSIFEVLPTLDEHKLDFSPASAPSTVSPFLRICGIPFQATEELLKQEISKFGIIAKFEFSSGSFSATCLMSNPLEAREAVKNGIYLLNTHVYIVYSSNIGETIDHKKMEMKHPASPFLDRHTPSAGNFHGSAKNKELYSYNNRQGRNFSRETRAPRGRDFNDRGRSRYDGPKKPKDYFLSGGRAPNTNRAYERPKQNSGYSNRAPLRTSATDETAGKRRTRDTQGTNHRRNENYMDSSEGPFKRNFDSPSYTQFGREAKRPPSERKNMFPTPHNAYANDSYPYMQYDQPEYPSERPPLQRSGPPRRFEPYETEDATRRFGYPSDAMPPREPSFKRYPDSMSTQSNYSTEPRWPQNDFEGAGNVGSSHPRAPRSNQANLNTIFINGFSPYFTEEKAHNYFSNFGKVLNVSFRTPRGSGKRDPSIGFVTFDNPYSVQKVVEKKEHSCEREVLKVDVAGKKKGDAEGLEDDFDRNARGGRFRK